MNFILLIFFSISIFPSLVLSQRASSNAQQICRNNRNAGMFAHEEYCDYYYECDNNGEAIVQSCPNGLAFAGARRGLISNCDYPHRVGCPDGQRVMGQQPITSENCHWQYGLFPHVTSCTRFWHCWNGTATIQQCPFSLLYNDALSICDYPQHVKDCMAHPICKDTPNGPVPLKRVVSDTGCVLVAIQDCKDIDKNLGPAGLAVNPSTLKCELATTVPGCEPPPTTGSTPVEEEEDESPQANSAVSQPNDSNNRPSSNSRPSSGSSSNSFRSSQEARSTG